MKGASSASIGRWAKGKDGKEGVRKGKEEHVVVYCDTQSID